MNLLSIRNLSVSIRDTAILQDVSLDLASGEILAITGESGSGKSMTALAALQLLPKGAQATGRIRLGTQDLLKMDETALCALRGRDIGMVFQEPMTALNPLHRIGAQVAETIRIHSDIGKKAAQTKAAQLLTRVGLSPDRFPPDRFPHELSGGQRQRVVIAMAIAMGPRLLIADEPTTALDVTTQAQILSLLVKLTRQERMGLLLITHDLAVVAKYADRIAVMKDGRIVETGPTAQLFQTMRHPYTRMLFEASAHQVVLPPVQPQGPLLQVSDLHRSYKLPRRRLFEKPVRFEAVRGVSFEIRRGERVGLVGESGCGKSTLSRALLGLEPLQAGQVMLDGVDVFAKGNATAALRRNVQAVFQDPYGSFNPRHKVGRLIAEPFHLRTTPLSKPDRDQAIGEALEDVGLSRSDANRYIHEFSGGQRQRIAIARALVIRPQLILLDEAVSALDVSVRARILDLLADLCTRHGLTYLFISHDLTVVRSVTDRVLVMQNGQFVEEGATEQIFTNPQHAYTKELLTAAPQLPAPPAAEVEPDAR